MDEVAPHSHDLDSAPAAQLGLTGRVYAAAFHQRWHQLNNPHVRALAWLLEAPNLLSPQAPRWQGKIASLAPNVADEVSSWLVALDAQPEALEQHLAVHRYTRLGRYAEHLLVWYFKHIGTLYAHSVQVRADKNETIGEFDFLLWQDQTLWHWEFATKFYLLCSSDPIYAKVQQADYFVGPNLADTLGAKMRKILDRQLLLGQHPAAAQWLPQPLAGAQALVKGWLFYRRGEVPAIEAVGVSATHCRGWWCTLAELENHLGAHAALLPRITWLAPARFAQDQIELKAQLQQRIAQAFASDPTPVMVASFEQGEGAWFETERGFVVPDHWQAAAAQRSQQGLD